MIIFLSFYMVVISNCKYLSMVQNLTFFPSFKSLIVKENDHYILRKTRQIQTKVFIFKLICHEICASSSEQSTTKLNYKLIIFSPLKMNRSFLVQGLLNLNNHFSDTAFVRRTVNRYSNENRVCVFFKFQIIWKNSSGSRRQGTR